MQNTMRTESFVIEADSVEEARQVARRRVGTKRDLAVLREDLLNDSIANTIVAIADSEADAYKRAEAQVPAEARIEKRENRCGAGLSVITVEGYDQASAEALVSLSPSQRMLSFRLKTLGRKGFLRIGKTASVFEAQVFQQAVVALTIRNKAKIRFTCDVWGS